MISMKPEYGVTSVTVMDAPVPISSGVSMFINGPGVGSWDTVLWLDCCVTGWDPNLAIDFSQEATPNGNGSRNCGYSC